METGVPGGSIVIVVAAGLLGLVVGSFLNVVIHRVPLRRSVVWPASRCPACGEPIRPKDNVPVLSYLLLRGRCRSCKARISARYPVVEALTGVLFAAAYAFGPSVGLLSALVLISVLVALAGIDLEHRLLPNVIVGPAAVVGFALSFLESPERWWIYPISALAVAGAIAGGLLMATGRIRRRHALPFGVFMALGGIVALFVGPQLWELYLDLFGDGL